jgi:hypothetical protein
MGDLSNFSEDELMDHIFNVAYSPETTMYVGMGTSADDTGLTAEPSGDNYAREIITFGAAASRKIIQAALVTFNQASGAWGTMASYGIFDAITAGNFLGWGDFNVPKPVINGNTPSIANGQAEISIGANEITDYLVHKLLDLMFRNQAYSKPATYVALLDTAGADDDTDITAKEPSGNGYARKLVNINGGATPVWKISSVGHVENNDIITMATPSGTWGVITAVGICDGLTTGNLLVYDNSPGGDGQTPTTDDTVQFAADAFDITLT